MNLILTVWKFDLFCLRSQYVPDRDVLLEATHAYIVGARGVTRNNAGYRMDECNVHLTKGWLRLS